MNQVVVGALLCRRTIALYNRSRAVSILLWGVGLILFGVCCSSIILVHPSTDFVRVISDLPGCHYLTSQQAAIHYAFAWEASAIFDTLIFTLTFMRTIKMRKVHRMSITLTGEGLMDIFLRDGALFFAIMALANVANICTFYFAGPSFRGALTTASSCISSALCSRLVLNLYDAATPDDTSSRSSYEPMTTVILTVPIEVTFDDCSEV
ncbi:hypothetical protein BC827DRAFT_231038 [Russula dissimulans]|nr:hypothetical protein BC827DRAFT_231038 [Russula dissimulans]